MQLSFAQQLEDLVDLARQKGTIDDPVIRDEIARSWCEVRIMRYTAQRTLAALDNVSGSAATSISKLYWSQWFQRFGELAMRIRGTSALVSEDADFGTDGLQQTFLFGRAVTIFAGSSQIQRNIIGESVLGLPREPR
jgi:alkylation response protein AidB-like acyl-CoA dehydrogenase